jgi:hypothetical protein
VPINDTVLAEGVHFIDGLPAETSASMAVDSYPAPWCEKVANSS